MAYNFIDLFSGAGGLSYGFTQAGLNCLAGVDSLKPAIETFKRNHPHSLAICDDIRRISTSDFEKKIKNKN